jgi:hypothetical protein
MVYRDHGAAAGMQVEADIIQKQVRRGWAGKLF